jgi:hypothetical protein
VIPDLPAGAIPFDVPHVSRPDGKTIRLRYSAVIDHPISKEGEDYARGFAETEGTIQAAGVFLGGGVFPVDWREPVCGRWR